jgi:hypothetical protein
MDYSLIFKSGNTIKITQQDLDNISNAIDCGINIVQGIKDNHTVCIFNVKEIECVIEIKRECQKSKDLSENSAWSKEFYSDVKINDPLETIVKTQINE